MGHLVDADAILLVRGAIDRRGGEEANLIVNELIPLDDLAARFTRTVRIRVDESSRAENVITNLHEILRGYPGTCEVELALMLTDGTKLLLKCNTPRVEICAELRTRVDDLLGPGNFRLIAATPNTRESTSRANGNGVNAPRGNFSRREPAAAR